MNKTVDWWTDPGSMPKNLPLAHADDVMGAYDITPTIKAGLA